MSEEKDSEKKPEEQPGAEAVEKNRALTEKWLKKSHDYLSETPPRQILKNTIIQPGKKLGEFVLANRAFFIISVAFIEFILVYCISDDKWFNDTMKFVGDNKLGTVAAVAFASPVAYVIWYIRDANRLAEIQNKRHDTFLKDFHKIEEWATALPQVEEEKRENIETEQEPKTELASKKKEKPSITQIAAIHQLRPYLLGNMGKDFQRPTFEIYKALLDSWQLKEEEEGKKRNAIDIPAYINAIRQIIFEEIDFFRKVPWKEEGQRGENEYQENLLKELDLKYFHLNNKNLAGLNLMGAKLSGAALLDANLRHADLRHVDLRDGNLLSADLRGANLIGTNLQSAKLQGADLRSANLMSAKVQGAEFEDANLQGADLRFINGGSAFFTRATYNNETKLHVNFDPKAHGMIEVDEDGKVIKDEE